jgi:ketosteroid isomerase-like protein
MASANLDLVRSIYADWERGDYSSTYWVDPEIEYIHPDGPEPGRWTGLAGIRQAARERLSAWNDYAPKAEEYRELDDERVLVLIRFTGRGKTSGLDLTRVQSKGATLFHIRGGKVTKILQYLSRDRALADLGLSPESDAPDAEGNAEIVRRAVEAANRKPKPDFETINALYHPDHVLISAISNVEGRGFEGARGFGQWLADIADSFESWEMKIDGLEEIDGKRLLLQTRFSARGKGGGVPVEQEQAAVVTVKDGKIRRTESYQSTEEAREAAGLAKDAPSGNVELVKSILAGWERGDFASAEWADPEIVFKRVEEGWRGRWTGLAGMAQGWREWLTAWEDFRVGVDEYRELDGERVLVLNYFTGRGKTSGLEVGKTQTKGASLFHVRDGKVIRLVAYATREVGLADLRDEQSPQGNVETVRRVLDAVGRRDVARLLALTDPEVEWRSFFAFDERGMYCGHDGLRQYVDDVSEAFEHLRPEPTDLLDAGNIVVGVGRIHYRGQESGLETESPAGWMFKFRGGKVVCFRAFRDPEQALETVGLSE